MSTSSVSATIPKVRTYAGDLDFVRAHPRQVPHATATGTALSSTPQQKPLGAEAPIPPFHTLKQATKAVPQTPATIKTGSVPMNQTETQNILNTSSQRSSAQNHQQDLPAVIITDTKHKRFRLGSAIATSVKDWFATKQKSVQKKKTPQYTVPEAGRRKGVIQKATSQTGRTTTADHTTVVSRIKATKQTSVVERINAPKPTIAVTPLPTIPLAHQSTPHIEPPKKATWNIVSQPQPVNTQTEETMLHNSDAIEITPTLTHAPSAPRITPIIPIKPTISPSVITPEPPREPSIKITPQIPQPTTDTIRDTLTTLERQDEDIANFLPINVIVPERSQGTERRFAPPREPEWSLRTFITQTNPIVMVTFLFMVLVIAGVFGIRSLLNTTPAPTTLTTETSVPTTFPDTTSVNPAVVVSTVTDMTTALRSQSAESLSEIILLNSYGASLTPEEFLTILNATVVFDFKASMTQVAVGSYRGAPWIVFTVTDKNTALGGMLNWENALYRTLSPLLPVTALSSAQKFSDGVIDGTDVRILKDTDGTEILVYGFSSQNTILITSDSSAFLNLKNKTL